MMDNMNNLTQKDLYVSYQPAFEKILGRYSECKSNEGSLQNVMLFYQFNMNDLEADQIFAVPGGCIDIVFCCDENNPSARVCGSVIRGKKISYKPNCEYFGIRLLPGYDRQFLKYPAKEFVEKEVPLNEILDKDMFITEMIAKGASFNNRISIIKAFLKYYNASMSPIPYLSQSIVEKIYKTNGQLQIHELACETGYSSRYIYRIIDECIGISPKLFSRIVRFQKVLGLLLRSDVSNINDIALKFGYYDQSHFLRECKEFCFLAPQQVAKNSKCTI